MIRLVRNPLPVGVLNRFKRWRGQLLSLIAKGGDARGFIGGKYRDPELKAVLRAESYGKCVYCESKVTQTYFGDVEHLRPKDLFPELALDHDNLGFACAICNNKKGVFWDDATPLLNPYVDNPADHLIALGPMVISRPTDQRADISVRLLELNRLDLVERRLERLLKLKPLVEELKVTPPGAKRELVERELRREFDADKEYTLAVKGYLTAMAII